MTRDEYNLIQHDLNALLDDEKLRRKGITGQDEKKAYTSAIRAAQSTINNLFLFGHLKGENDG